MFARSSSRTSVAPAGAAPGEQPRPGGAWLRPHRVEAGQPGQPRRAACSVKPFGFPQHAGIVAGVLQAGRVFDLTGEVGGGEGAHQVVQAVAFGSCVPIEQAAPVQPAQQVAGCSVQHGVRCRAVEGRGEDAERRGRPARGRPGYLP